MRLPFSHYFFIITLTAIFATHVSIPTMVSSPSGNYPELIQKKNNNEFWGEPSQATIMRITYAKNPTKSLQEFQHHNKVHQAFTAAHDAQFKTRATVVTPGEITVFNDHTAFSMERLHALDGTTKLRRLQLGSEAKNYKSNKNYLYVKNIVNEYVPTNTVQPTVRDNIEQLCYDLGYLIALMHLAAKVDGLGTKIYLTKKSQEHQNSYKITLSNFAQTRDLNDSFLNENSHEIVRSLLTSMVRTQDYPTPNYNGFYIFKSGYIACAQDLDTKEKTTRYHSIAEKLFAEYESIAGHYKPQRLLKATQNKS